MLAFKDENHVDPLPSVGTPQTSAEMHAELGDSQDAGGLVQAWGPQEQPTLHLRLSGNTLLGAWLYVSFPLGEILGNVK